jgi:type III secretion protein C
MSLCFISPWRGCLHAAALAALCAASAASAATMPNASHAVAITAREQPIGAFLQDLFATIDVPAVIAPALTGAVNGTFTGPAERVLRDVARVYNLVTYFDGTAMFVVPATDLARRTYVVAPTAAARLLREATMLGLPDSRNTLKRNPDGNMLAVGTQRFVEQVDELIRTIDPAGTPQASGGGTVTTALTGRAPGSSAADFRVFYLRYAWAQDTTVTLTGRQVVLPGVASILRSLVGGASSAPIAQDVRLRPTQPSLRGQGLAAQGTAVKASAAKARDNATDTLVAALARTALPQAEAVAVPAPDGQPIRIEADPRLNAVIVRDLAERMPRYEQLIAALDVEPQSLEIEATIIDVNTDRMRELGVNWRWNGNSIGAQVGNRGAGALPGAGGVSAVLDSVGQFVARINVLQAEGAARIVSSPQVVTLSDVEAVFDNSSTFYVRVAGRDEVDLFNVSAGTSLRVTPHVLRDKGSTRIKLMVHVEDGSLSRRQVDQIPVVERSTISTQALIVQGESLLIGGMTRDSVASSVDKVPGLSDVPVIGNLFKNRSETSARVERMFLITPRLAVAWPAGAGATLQAGAPAPPVRASVEIDLDAPPQRGAR